MLRKIGLFSRRAFVKASSSHACQSTGLCACWRRYGDFSRARRFVCACVEFLESVVTTFSFGFARPLSAPADHHDCGNATNMRASLIGRTIVRMSRECKRNALVETTVNRGLPAAADYKTAEQQSATLRYNTGAKPRSRMLREPAGRDACATAWFRQLFHRHSSGGRIA